MIKNLDQTLMKNKMLFWTTQYELIDTLKDAIKMYTRKLRDYKILKGIYNSLNDSANKLVKENEFLNSRICFLENQYVYNEQIPIEHENALQ
jgi:hypothetical protein